MWQSSKEGDRSHHLFKGGHRLPRCGIRAYHQRCPHPHPPLLLPDPDPISQTRWMDLQWPSAMGCSGCCRTSCTGRPPLLSVVVSSTTAALTAHMGGTPLMNTTRCLPLLCMTVVFGLLTAILRAVAQNACQAVQIWAIKWYDPHRMVHLSPFLL